MSGGARRARRSRFDRKVVFPDRVLATLILVGVLLLLSFRLDSLSGIAGVRLYNIVEMVGFIVDFTRLASADMIGVIISTTVLGVIFIIILPSAPVIARSSWLEVRRSFYLAAGLYKLVYRYPRPLSTRIPLLFTPLRFHRGITCRMGGSVSSLLLRGLLCPGSLQAEEAVIEKIISNPLRLLKYPAKPRAVRVLPVVALLFTAASYGLALVLMEAYGLNVSLYHAVGLLLLPLLMYVLAYIAAYAAATGDLAFWRKLKAKELDEELPYVTAFTGALLFSGLNIVSVFGYASKFIHMPEFRRLSRFIFRIQRLTGKNILDVIEDVGENHPVESARIFLSTLASVEKIGGQRFAAVAKLQEVLVERLQRKVKSFLDTVNLMLTLSMMAFVLVPMISVIIVFLFSNLMGPAQYKIAAIVLPLASAALLIMLIEYTYVYEVTERYGPKVIGPAAVAAGILLASIVIPMLLSGWWLDNVLKSSPVALALQNVATMMAVPYTGDSVISYSALVNVLVAVLVMPLILVSYSRYLKAQWIFATMQDLTRAIAEQARIGIRPSVAVRKFIMLRFLRARDRFYRVLHARLSRGASLLTLLDGVDREVGFEMPRGIYRLFELLHYMEKVGLEPRSIERFADMLVDVFAIRQEIRSKARTAALTGLVFVVMLAGIVAVLKVSLIDNIETMRELSSAARSGYGYSVGFRFLEFRPLTQSERSEALLLAYYMTLLSAFLLGYVIGKILSNSVVTAALVAAVSVIIVGLVIAAIPLLKFYMPF